MLMKYHVVMKIVPLRVGKMDLPTTIVSLFTIQNTRVPLSNTRRSSGEKTETFLNTPIKATLP